MVRGFEREIYEFIHTNRGLNYEQIAQQTGYSVSKIKKVVSALARKKLIKFERNPRQIYPVGWTDLDWEK